MEIKDDDIRPIILGKKKDADILTIDLHVDAVDKEHAHLALVGLIRHVLCGKYMDLFLRTFQQ